MSADSNALHTESIQDAAYSPYSLDCFLRFCCSCYFFVFLLHLYCTTLFGNVSLMRSSSVASCITSFLSDTYIHTYIKPHSYNTKQKIGNETLLANRLLLFCFFPILYVYDFHCVSAYASILPLFHRCFVFRFLLALFYIDESSNNETSIDFLVNISINTISFIIPCNGEIPSSLSRSFLKFKIQFRPEWLILWFLIDFRLRHILNMMCNSGLCSF